MGSQRLDQLPEAGPLDGDELLYVVQDGNDRRIPSDTHRTRDVVMVPAQGSATSVYQDVRDALDNNGANTLVLIFGGSAFIDQRVDIGTDQVVEIAANASAEVPGGYTGTLFRLVGRGSRVGGWGTITEQATVERNWIAIEPYDDDDSGVYFGGVYGGLFVDEVGTGLLLNTVSPGWINGNDFRLTVDHCVVGVEFSNGDRTNNNRLDRVLVQCRSMTTHAFKNIDGDSNALYECISFDHEAHGTTPITIASTANDTRIVGGNLPTEAAGQGTDTKVFGRSEDKFVENLGRDTRTEADGPDQYPFTVSLLLVTGSNADWPLTDRPMIVHTVKTELEDYVAQHAYEIAGDRRGWWRVRSSTSSFTAWRPLGHTDMNAGVVTFSGDGSTTTFSVPHGLGSTPTARSVWGESADAAGDKYVGSVGPTNIDVTFATAPASGTDNVALGFDARL